MMRSLAALIAVCSSFGVGHASHLRAREQRPQPGFEVEHADHQGPLIRSWYTDKTKDFWVNGSAIPEVPFNIGESYAGLLPISSDLNEDRTLYFWFFPSSNPNATNEVALWFNGGPGCSSLSGLITENGPFTWMDGTEAPVQNPYSWSNLTNMIWIEQPVGVGYTTGVPSISDETQLGLQFIGFWKNFVNTFDMHNFEVYLTGESYAGYYVPYIADAFITANDTDYYNLKGIAINNPTIGDDTNQGDVTIMPYVHYWQNLFYLNQSTIEILDNYNDYCNYTSYFDKYFTFPPPQEPFPLLPDPYESPTYECDMFDYVYAALLEVNPCFNIYHVTDTCPHLSSQLGIVNEGDYQAPGAQIYFNRTDVKAALHAPLDTNWMQCTEVNVFANQPNRSTNYSAGHDTSTPCANNGVLQRVIEHTSNVIVGSGNLDFLLNTNGTLLAIQNMTWNGLRGLQAWPSNEFYVPYHEEYNGGALAGAGTLGKWTEERGLTFYDVQLAGHELPGYALGAGYGVLEKLLGRIDSFSDTRPFTTQQQKAGKTRHKAEAEAMMVEKPLMNIHPGKQRLLNARKGAREEL